MFGVMQHLTVKTYQSPSEAPIYREGFQPIEIEKVIVVHQGTEAGHSTVDLILTTKDKQKFVVMVTGNLIQTLAALCK